LIECNQAIAENANRQGLVYVRHGVYRPDNRILSSQYGACNVLIASQITMDVLTTISGLLCLGLFVYLFAALLKPEWFK
jgi:K+-transporting ATPase KdpF subunit